MIGLLNFDVICITAQTSPRLPPEDRVNSKQI